VKLRAAFANIPVGCALCVSSCSMECNALFAHAHRGSPVLDLAISNLSGLQPNGSEFACVTAEKRM